MENSTQNGEEGGWISFHELVTHEGLEAATEMVIAKTVHSRPHSKLTKDTKLRWPYNLEVTYTKEVWDRKKNRLTGDAR